MSLRTDLKTLYHIVWKRARGADHAARMEDFYGRQAADYDDFREKMLRGRKELYDLLPAPENGVWVELGCGTGRNLEFLGQRIQKLRKVYLVDLSESMLNIAKQRIARQGWSNVETVVGDATTFLPPHDQGDSPIFADHRCATSSAKNGTVPAEGLADVVTFSYSLTMIPPWTAALDHARAILKPGGSLGVVDFHVSQKFPVSGFVRHPFSTRTFWPALFGIGNVFVSPDHLPYLERHFERAHLFESRLKIPYVPLLRVPYYYFVGKRP
jgi:S-adenosylmethionine-diacylgycerolhomoserine-N-methlytransferase